MLFALSCHPPPARILACSALVITVSHRGTRLFSWVTKNQAICRVKTIGSLQNCAKAAYFRKFSCVIFAIRRSHNSHSSTQAAGLSYHCPMCCLFVQQTKQLYEIAPTALSLSLSLSLILSGAPGAWTLHAMGQDRDWGEGREREGEGEGERGGRGREHCALIHAPPLFAFDTVS